MLAIFSGLSQYDVTFVPLTERRLKVGRANAKARAVMQEEKLNRIAAIRSQEYARQQNLDHLKAEIANLLYELKKHDYPNIRPVKVKYGPFTITRGGWQVAVVSAGSYRGEYQYSTFYLLADGTTVNGIYRSKIQGLRGDSLDDVLDGVRNLRAELRE